MNLDRFSRLDQRRQIWLLLAALLCLAVLLRGALLASDSVSFHSDEAVVSLMARHILQGERPVFFYGQAYMGSLDAWLVAAGFALLGESVLTVRIVQSVLYLLAVGTGVWAAWKLSGQRLLVAAVAGLVLTVSPVLLTLYTTATLGGYNETLILGHLLLILGWDVTHEHPRSIWRWAAIGACAGLGFWTNGLIVVYLLPVGLLGLRHFARRQIPFYAVAAAAAILFSAPWWIYDFQHDHAALSFYLHNRPSRELAGMDAASTSLVERIFSLFIFNFPALFGMRFPWKSTFFLLPVGLPVLMVFVLAVYVLARRRDVLEPEGRFVTLGLLGVHSLIFVISRFGADPSGRYVLPMLLPLAIALGALAAELRRAGGGWWWALPVGLVIGYYAAGQITAASSDMGLTTQFDPVSHISNDHDEAVIDFLDAQEIAHGYTNYWVAFRLAFLSQERIQLDAALPYKTDLSYNTGDRRYPPYLEATARADRIAYITTEQLPELDDLLLERLDAAGITYRRQTVGPYYVTYDLSRRVAPHELGFSAPEIRP
jgi:4-amino-4-deoxy-L-arabinose transferase-like glycosyltransferase